MRRIQLQCCASLRPALGAAVLATGLFASGAGLAGPLVEQAARVEAMIAAGKDAEAVAAARAMFDAVWDGVGTNGFTQTLLLDRPVEGFGLLVPRADASYAKGQPILIYAEPFGFGFGKTASGLFVTAFAIDLTVLAADGSTLGTVPDIIALSTETRARNTQFFAELTYTLPDVPPGTYTLRTTMRDRNSDRAGTFDLRIEVRP